MHINPVLKPSVIQTHFDMLSSMGVLVGDFYKLLGNKYEVSPDFPHSYGRMKDCYMNAFKLVEANPQYTYCEGYSESGKVPIPIHHAWVLDPEGRVLDPTWKVPGREYVGLALRWDFVQDAVLAKKAYGLLGEMVPRGMVDNSPKEYLEPRWAPSEARLVQWESLLAKHFQRN